VRLCGRSKVLTPKIKERIILIVRWWKGEVAPGGVASPASKPTSVRCGFDSRPLRHSLYAVRLMVGRGFSTGPPREGD